MRGIRGAVYAFPVRFDILLHSPKHVYLHVIHASIGCYMCLLSDSDRFLAYWTSLGEGKQDQRHRQVYRLWHKHVVCALLAWQVGKHFYIVRTKTNSIVLKME